MLANLGLSLAHPLLLFRFVLAGSLRYVYWRLSANEQPAVGYELDCNCLLAPTASRSLITIRRAEAWALHMLQGIRKIAKDGKTHGHRYNCDWQLYDRLFRYVVMCPDITVLYCKGDQPLVMARFGFGNRRSASITPASHPILFTGIYPLCWRPAIPTWWNA